MKCKTFYVKLPIPTTQLYLALISLSSKWARWRLKKKQSRVARELPMLRLFDFVTFRWNFVKYKNHYHRLTFVRAFIYNLFFLHTLSQPFSYHSLQSGNIKDIANSKYTDVPVRCNKWSARVWNKGCGTRNMKEPLFIHLCSPRVYDFLLSSHTTCGAEDGIVNPWLAEIQFISGIQKS